MGTSRTTAARALATAVGVISLVSLAGLAAAAPGTPVSLATPRARRAWATRTSRLPATVDTTSSTTTWTSTTTRLPRHRPAVEGQLRGVATIDLRRHPGSRPLQPRPARDGRLGDHDQRQACDRHRAPGTRGRGRRRGVLAGPGRRRAPLGAHRPAPTQAQEGPDGADRRDLRRHDHPTDRHRGRAVRLGDHARRCDGRQRAGRVDDVVPGQRPPDRQGHLPLRDHRAEGQGRGGQRTPRAGPGDGARVDDVVLGRSGPAGQLPHHGVGGRLRPALSETPGGLPIIDAVDDAPDRRQPRHHRRRAWPSSRR